LIDASVGRKGGQVAVDSRLLVNATVNSPFKKEKG